METTSAVQYEVKFKKLLDRFLEPDFQTASGVYLDKLISHLSGDNNRELVNSLLNLPLFAEWIIQCSTRWEVAQELPSKTMSIFILHLTGLLSQNEQRFICLKTYNVYNTLCTVLKVRESCQSPSIKVAYIKLLSSFLCHNSGMDWLISTSNWRDILQFSIDNHTVYIVRESQKFMLNLVKKSVQYNEVFCNVVIKQIALKLNDFMCNQNGKNCIARNNEDLQGKIMPVLKLISYIFENAFEKDTQDYCVPILFIKKFQLEATIEQLKSHTQDVDLLYELDKIVICMHFLVILSECISDDGMLDVVSVQKIGNNLLKSLGIHITKERAINVLKFCHYADYLWHFILKRIPTPKNETHVLRAENQLLPIEMCPIVIFGFIHCSFSINDVDMDELRDDFVTKIFKAMSEQTTRLAYQWKNILVRYPHLVSLTQQSILYIMNNRKICKRSRAVMTFQCLIYALKDVTRGMKLTCCKKSDIFLENPNYLVLLINTLSTFISEFEITWTDTVETICVLSVTIEFLNIPLWSPRVVVEAMKLLKLSIEKYMSPNLALLVDNTENNALHLLSPLLRLKLNDSSWEIRDSALEILITISTIACTKFPSFQKMLLNSNLIAIIVNMSTSDGESYVRASAIKCLQEMIKVNEFWNSTLAQCQLPEKMVGILKHETEGVVRKEASCLMRCIYEYQSFPDNIMDAVYDAMSYAATSDLYWEVKTNALDFWGKVTLNHLQNQGMIDGRFPDVTFSKEHRKIVTLTEHEIKNRLTKVLQQLSANGCLGVFMTAMQEDCDLEVIKLAVLKCKKIANLLQNYNFTSVYYPKSNSNSPKTMPMICPSTCQKSPDSTFNTPPVTPVIDYSDDVIDQIINSTDLNLLTIAYNLKQGASITMDYHQKNIVKVSPETFLAFIQTNLDSMVDGKSHWNNSIEDLDSLLDDMLKDYTANVNSMDCY